MAKKYAIMDHNIEFPPWPLTEDEKKEGATPERHSLSLILKHLTEPEYIVLVNKLSNVCTEMGIPVTSQSPE